LPLIHGHGGSVAGIGGGSLIYGGGGGGGQQQTNFSNSNISLNTGVNQSTTMSPKLVRLNYPSNSPKSSTHRHHHHSHLHKYAHHHAHQIRTPNPIVLYSATSTAKQQHVTSTSSNDGCSSSSYFYNSSNCSSTANSNVPGSTEQNNQQQVVMSLDGNFKIDKSITTVDQSFPTDYQQPKLITFKSTPPTTAFSHSQLPMVVGSCGNCDEKLRGGTLGRNVSLSRKLSNDTLGSGQRGSDYTTSSSTSYLLKSSLSHGNLHLHDTDAAVVPHQYGACSNQKFHPCTHNHNSRYCLDSTSKCPTKKITFISPQETSSGENLNQSSAVNSKSTIL
jgi:hypothetical protein